MTPLEIARIYTQVVTLHDGIPEDEATAKDLVSSFRSDIHHLLMDTFHKHSISFASRFEAARMAFRMVREEEGGEDGTPR